MIDFDPTLLLITDRQATNGRPLVDVVCQALAGGVTAVMLREKDLSARELYPLARELREVTRQARAALIVNDRADVALAAAADGVHLGWQSLPLPAVRTILGPHAIIGVSTHGVDELVKAQKTGADYATFGPVYPTPSKTGLVPVQGVEALCQAAGAVAPFPVVALGGIEPGNASPLKATGAAGIAVIRSILSDPDPAEAAHALRIS